VLRAGICLNTVSRGKDMSLQHCPGAGTCLFNTVQGQGHVSSTVCPDRLWGHPNLCPVGAEYFSP
jgi:hypothetical protein